MRFRIFFLLPVILLQSCLFSNEGDVESLMDRPKQLIPKEEMAELMAHVSIIESAYAIKYVQLIRYSVPMSKDIDDYLAKKEITSTSFQQNIRYYTTQSDDWLDIQNEVNRILKEKQTEQQ